MEWCKLARALNGMVLIGKGVKWNGVHWKEL